MEKKRIESYEHLNVFEVIIGGTVKRYEIYPDSGYEFYRKKSDTAERGLVLFPAAWGLKNILDDITVREI